MKITYMGKDQDFTPFQQKKLDARFLRMGKMVERNGGERKAHVTFKTTRHLTKADIAMNFHSQQLAGAASSSDAFTALTAAVDNLEKQLQKTLEKTREPRRDNIAKKLNGTAGGNIVAVAAAATEDEAHAVKVYRVKNARQKPMTLEEAILQIGDKKDYLIYRDTDKSECMTVLIRRKDGHFDLVQSQA